MKIVKSSCSSKRKVRTCTFSPQVNIKNKRTAVQTEQDVNAAHSEAKLQDLINDIKSNIYTKVKAVATSPEFGFDENEVDDYFFVETSATEIGEDHHEAIRVEVRGEVSYEGLEDLMEALNPIIESYDSYAYFEPVEPGIIEAYVSVNQVDMSIYGATASPDHMFYDYHGKRFSVHDNSSEIGEDNIDDVYFLWKGSISQQAGAYNDADEDYVYAFIRGRGVIEYYKKGKYVATDNYTLRDENDFEYAWEYMEIILQDVCDRLIAYNKDVPDRMVYNSTSIQAADDEFHGYADVASDSGRSVEATEDLSSYPEEFRNAYQKAKTEFINRYPNLGVSIIRDDPYAEDGEVAVLVKDYDTGDHAKCYLVYSVDEMISSDYEWMLQAFEETAEAIGLLEDNTVYSSIESSDYESDSGIFIEDIIDSLKDNGYDLSRIRSIRRGLLELFGYKGKDADIIIHDLVAGGFIDPNDWIDKDYIPGIYSATGEDDGEGYWFFTTHGVQPGSVPRDVDILDIIDTPNGSFVKFDRFLSTKELNEYDMVEKAPESVMSSKESDVRLGDTVESDESLESILSELRDGGFDTSDIYEIQMGLGAYLGYDSEDIKEIVNDLISNGLVDTYSNTSSTDDKVFIEDIIDGLEDNAYNLNDLSSIKEGLWALFGYQGKDADDVIEDLVAGGFVDSNVLIDSGRKSIYSDTEEDDDDLPMVDQEYDSAATSINSNKLPAIYKMVNFNEGDVVVDFGGGKFDNAVEYIRDKGATLCVYDPYNRSAEHNKEVLRILRENGGADAAVNSNVLNVIKEPEARKNVLENIARITKPGAPIYITVYEGKGNGQEGPTKSGYQLNRKTADYLEEIQEVFPDATRRGKLITAHNTGSVTSSTDDQSRSTILCSYDEFLTWYDNLSDEEQSKVDDIADTNGIPFYEEASDDELAWLHDVATIEIYASPVKSYTDVEEDISRYDKDIVSYRKIISKSVEDSDDFLTDYTMYEVVTEDGSVEYECYFGDNDIYGPWNGEGLDFSSEDYDEAVEWYNSYSSDEIEASESIEADAFSSLEDQYLSPPEYDDSIEHEDSQELIEVELDQVITVDVDGDYEWDDDTYVWASPDGSNEEWRSEDGVYIDDKVGVVEHIDDLIIPNVPTRPGKYRITGLAELIYDVSGIQEYRTEYGPDDYESDLDTDHAVVSFNFSKSTVENLKITPVRR